MNVLNLRYSNELIKRNINGDVALYQDYWGAGEYCLVGCRKKWFFLAERVKDIRISLHTTSRGCIYLEELTCVDGTQRGKKAPRPVFSICRC